MGLSRKRTRELKRLKKAAAELWADQRDVLEHAGGVARETGRQIGNASREEVVPRVRHAYEDRIVPAASQTYNTVRSTASDAKHKVVHDYLPHVSSSVASAFATLEVSKDPRVRDIVKHVHKTGDKVSKNAEKAFAEASKRAGKVSKSASKAYNKYGQKVGLVKQKQAIGFGGWVLIVLGVAAVAGVAYAAWQTLRADDELWVVDESDDGDSSK